MILDHARSCLLCVSSCVFFMFVLFSFLFSFSRPFHSLFPFVFLFFSSVLSSMFFVVFSLLICNPGFLFEKMELSKF